MRLGGDEREVSVTTMRPVFDRALEKIAYEPMSGCWLWTGALTEKGYGKFNVGGKTIRAHRYTYQQVKGDIPTGFQLDHLCRTRSCVNPQHLEPVTCRENLRRSTLVGRKRRHGITGDGSCIIAVEAVCRSGHKLQEFGRQKNGRVFCRECERQYEAKRRG